MSQGMCIENDKNFTSPTARFTKRRRSCHVFAMVHQILLQAIGRGTPQFFFGVSSEGKKTNVLQFL